MQPIKKSDPVRQGYTLATTGKINGMKEGGAVGNPLTTAKRNNGIPGMKKGGKVNKLKRSD